MAEKNRNIWENSENQSKAKKHRKFRKTTENQQLRKFRIQSENIWKPIHKIHKINQKQNIKAYFNQFLPKM